MGNDTVSGKAMVIKDGKFGLYVTDGETNASLRKSDDLDTLTDERCWELLADRREREPTKKKASATRGAAKKAAKRATKKKAAAKKAVAKKGPAKAAVAKASVAAGGVATDNFDDF